jgi:hypothetical protein
LAFTVEDLARTALVRILPRSRYRLAAQGDARFASFAPSTSRIAYRQQGATPSFLLFSGPGQDPRAAATAAATWAEANWRPNAVQRKVRPGVVVVQVAPAGEMTAAGPVEGTAVPAAIWTVDSMSGRVEVAGNPPGSPSGGEVRRAAVALAQGLPAPSLGELDLAERSLMQTRTIAMPQVLGGAMGILLVIFALRYGIGGLFSLLALPAIFGAAGNVGSLSSSTVLLYGGFLINVLMLAGILFGLAVYFNVRNLAFSLPGFSSSVPRTRNLAWGGYAAIMIVFALVLDVALPAAERSFVRNTPAGQITHVTATVDDDGSETAVAVNGDLTVDLSAWPSSEWSAVQFKTSNPSVLTLDAPPAQTGPPVARFTAHQIGTARVDAASADGRYTYQLRVTVIA